jgi:hypothetical protein
MPALRELLMKDVPDTLPIVKALPMGPKRIELSAQDCKILCDMAGITYQDGYESRVLEYVITNEAKDRYGDIVRAAGVDLTNYKREPVVHLSHDTKTFPIGNSIKIWYDSMSKSIKSWTLFLDERVDKSGLSDTAFRFASNGHMKGASVGFLPRDGYIPKTESERIAIGLGEHGKEYRTSELLEYSICSIPCNPNALTQMSLKIADFNELLKEMNKHNCRDHSKESHMEPEKNIEEKTVEEKKVPEIIINKDMHDKLDGLKGELGLHKTESMENHKLQGAKVDALAAELSAHKESSESMHGATVQTLCNKLEELSNYVKEIKEMFGKKPVDEGEETGSSDAGNKAFYADVMSGISNFRKSINQ